MSFERESARTDNEVTNPFKGLPMSDEDDKRWRLYVYEVSAYDRHNQRDGYNQFFLTWLDPDVTEPGFRSRLAAALTAPMAVFGASSRNIYLNGELESCFEHEVMGKGNTPPDLRTLVEDRPELALELAEAILSWRKYSDEYFTSDLKNQNHIIEQIREVVSRQSPEITQELTNPSLAGSTLKTRPSYGDDDTVIREQPRHEMSVETPKIHLDPLRQKEDRYHSLALAMQDSAITADDAARYTQEWIDLADEHSSFEACLAGIFTGRIKEHIKALANNEASDPDVLTAIVQVMHQNGEPKESLDPVFSTDIVFKINDEALKEELATKIVMQLIDACGHSVSDKSLVIRPLHTIDERRAAGWLRAKLDANERLTASQNAVREICEGLIEYYDEEESAEAKRAAGRRAAQAAVRQMLHGTTALDCSI